MIPLTENTRGAIFMVLSMAAFVANDTLVKLVLVDVPLFPTILVRGLVATALLIILAQRKRVLRPHLSAQEWRLVLLRMAAEVGGTLCFLTALANMPLANIMAILQAAPLAVTLGAALVLGEAVGWRRYSAIAVGFIGVLIIIQPGSEGFSIYALWAVATVGFITVRDLATRQMPNGIPSIFVALITAAGITATGGIGALFLQSSGALGVEAVALCAVAAVFIVAAYLFSVEAMRHGEIGFVSPFRYTGLIWAIVLGWAVFGDLPTAPMLIGSAIVVAMGAYTFYRERALRKRAAAMRPFEPL
jgi:drug/metabolite transporter (DMT)-like permease